MKFINVGYGNLIALERIVSVATPDSAPIKRLVSDAKESGRAVDLCCGKKCKSVIVCDTDHIITCSISPESILSRLDNSDDSDLIKE